MFSPREREIAGLGWVLTEQLGGPVKRLHKALVKYYTEHLDLRLPQVPPSLTLIAKSQNVDETVSLLQIVLAAAVQSERKERYIQGIQTMSREAQEVIMKLLEDVSLRICSWRGLC